MKAYKVQLIFDNPNAEAFWRKQLYLSKECYDFASDIVYSKKLKFGIKVIHDAVYHKEREAFPELMSQLTIQVNNMLSANYKAAMANWRKLSKKQKERNLAKGKDRPDKCVCKRPSLQLDKRTYSHLEKSSIRICSGERGKRCAVRFKTYPKFDELASRYVMADPRLCLSENGKIMLSVAFKTPDVPVKDESTLGIDLGCRRIVTTSDGVAYTDKAYLARRRKIRHLKRQLNRHKRNSHSARTKLKSVRHYEFNMSKDFCHRLANEILKTDKSILVLEDLEKIKQRTSVTEDGVKRTKHNNRLSQVPFFRIKQILSYKAQALGKRVETVSPYKTSQEDCRSGSTEGCERVGCRFYAADGRVFDADWNAAINIRNRKRPGPFSLPLDGRLNLPGRPSQQADRQQLPSGSEQASRRAFSAVGS